MKLKVRDSLSIDKTMWLCKHVKGEMVIIDAHSWATADCEHDHLTDGHGPRWKTVGIFLTS